MEGAEAAGAGSGACGDVVQRGDGDAAAPHAARSAPEAGRTPSGGGEAPADGHGGGGAGGTGELTPDSQSTPRLKSALKRRPPGSAPLAAPAFDEVPSHKRSRGSVSGGARSASGKSVQFRRQTKTLGRAEAGIDRTPHDMPNTCDECFEYCLRGTWHCGLCGDFDLCRVCYTRVLPRGAPPNAPAPPPWSHLHGRDAFSLMDAPPPGDDDSDSEGAAATRAAAAAASAGGAGDAAMSEEDADNTAPRELAAAFEADAAQALS